MGDGGGGWDISKEKRAFREHRHGKEKGKGKRKEKKERRKEKKKKRTYGEKALSRSASNWCAEAFFLNVGRQNLSRFPFCTVEQGCRAGQ